VGAIARVAHRNATSPLILRGVTLVGPDQAKAEGDPQLFQDNAALVMQNLVADLPHWLLVWR